MKTYTTTNLALSAYLSLKGLKYVKADLGIGRNDKPVISFIFEDPKEMGRDLELDFMHSEIKKYRDHFFYFRNEIERVNRQMSRIQSED